MTESTEARRADATRNRQHILAVAAEAYATSEAHVSMAEIARRSGVGPATLYRNFASRHELLEALYRDEVDALCDAVRTAPGETAGDRFIAWARRFVQYFLAKRHVAGELLEAGVGAPLFNASRERVVLAATPLLDEAQAAGEVTGALSLDQMLDMLAAVARIPGDREYVGPVLELTLEGLRSAVTS